MPIYCASCRYFFIIGRDESPDEEVCRYSKLTFPTEYQNIAISQTYKRSGKQKKKKKIVPYEDPITKNGGNDCKDFEKGFFIGNLYKQYPSFRGLLYFLLFMQLLGLIVAIIEQ